MVRSEDPLSILIAEDDDTLAAALDEFLRERGHQVDLATDGGAALALLEKKVLSSDHHRFGDARG